MKKLKEKPRKYENGQPFGPQRSFCPWQQFWSHKKSITELLPGTLVGNFSLAFPYIHPQLSPGTILSPISACHEQASSFGSFVFC